MADSPDHGIDMMDAAGAGLRGPRLWAVVAVALLPGVIIAMTIALVIPIVPAIAAHFGGNAGGRLLAQYFVAITGVGTMMGAALGGVGVDRLGFRPVVVTSMLVYVAAGVGGAVIDNAVLALAARLVIGMGCGGLAAASLPLLGQRWQGAARARALGYVTALGAGAAIPLVIIGGFVGQRFGWRAPFLLFALALPLVVLSLFLPAGTRQREQPTRKILPAEWRSIAPVVMTGAALYLVLFVTSIQFPLLLSDSGFQSSGTRSILLAVPSLATVIAALMFVRLNRVISHQRMTMLLLVLFGSGVATMSLMHGVVGALLAGVLAGFGVGLTPSHISRELLERAAPEIRGRAGATLVLSRYTAQIFNPLLLGSLGAIVGLRVSLRVLACLLLLWLVLAAWAEFAGGGRRAGRS